MEFVKLESDRLLIRPFKIGDEQAILELNSNSLVQKYTGDTLLTTKEQAEDVLHNIILKDYEIYGYGRFAVIYKPEQKFIGFTGIKYLPEANGESDLGYRFLPEYWGKGIATESSKMALDFGFNGLQLKKILGFTELKNKASTRVLEKVGFKINKIDFYPGEENDLSLSVREQENTNKLSKKKVNWLVLKKEDYER